MDLIRPKKRPYDTTPSDRLQAQTEKNRKKFFGRFAPPESVQPPVLLGFLAFWGGGGGASAPPRSKKFARAEALAPSARPGRAARGARLVGARQKGLKRDLKWNLMYCESFGTCNDAGRERKGQSRATCQTKVQALARACFVQA